MELKFLEQKKKEQEEKELKRQKRLTKKANKKKGAKTKPRRQLKFSSSDDVSSHSIPYIDTDDDMHLEDFETDKFCIICVEEGKDELWYQCFKCLKWAHAECSGWDRRERSHRKTL